ncbi:pyruvate kinase [Microbacteriaceae bacterium 4G12]
MRKTKIVCTIGPATDNVNQLVQLIEAGMNVARLNFSHGTHEEHKARILSIREAAEQTKKTIAILLDIKGPKIRTHEFEGGQAKLKDDAIVMISMQKTTGTAERFSITYEGLYEDVEVGSRLLLDDGLMELEVIEKVNGELKTKVIHGGIIKNNKGVNVPNVKIRLPGVTEKDIKDIIFGIEQGVDYIAASFVRKAEDVLEVKHILSEHNSMHIHVIPKIENQEGIDNIDSILEVADGVMVARGDMGIEVAVEEVPLIQKTIIKKCNATGKPVITATQMLDSMQRNPRPTRAEASDVANAIFDGTDAIMLSGETAAGLYPTQAVETMHRIAMRVEQSLKYEELHRTQMREYQSTTEVIGQSVSHSALVLQAKAILAPTDSGYTAKMISKYRPKAPIIAVTFDEHVCRKLSLVWGVHALSTKKVTSTDEMLTSAIEAAKTARLITKDDIVIITAGLPVGATGTTNLMKIYQIE